MTQPPVDPAFQHGHRRVHGQTPSPTYSSWRAMRKRVECPGNIGYRNYGGRGIVVCERWKTFVNFLADMGERPPKTTLDRIDTNGNYEASNCRWATYPEQLNNTRRNRQVEYRGERMSVSQWAMRSGVPYRLLFVRLARGWPMDEALTTPKHPRDGSHIPYRPKRRPPSDAGH